MRGFCSFFVAMFLWQVTAHAQDIGHPINVCSHLGFEPYVIPEGQKLSGIDIDIVEEALNRADIPYEIVALPWARLISSLKSGTCDIGFSLFDRSFRREFASYLFDVPIHTSNIRVYSLKENNMHFEKVSDLFGLNVAHNRGFSLTYELEFGVEARKIQRFPYDDPQSALNMLHAGRIDMILENEQRLAYYLKKQGGKDNVISQDIPFLSHEPAFLVISKASQFNTDDLHRRLKQSLIEMEDSGRIAEINQKYR